MQERIITQPYGADKEFFKYSLFLVLCNRILTVTLAFGLLLVPHAALRTHIVCQALTTKQRRLRVWERTTVSALFIPTHTKSAKHFCTD